MDNFLWRSTETTDSFIYSRASKKRVGTFPIAQQEISRQYFCCQDISCWATGNIPTMLFCCRDISCCQKLCRDISCCSTGNIPTAFFAVGIFPVVQFCRDISPWHNVGIFPIGCVGTSTFPRNSLYKNRITSSVADLNMASKAQSNDTITQSSVKMHCGNFSGYFHTLSIYKRQQKTKEKITLSKCFFGQNILTST
jgi:hypothetical protein